MFKSCKFNAAVRPYVLVSNFRIQVPGGQGGSLWEFIHGTLH